jgi:phosphoribosylaminoimidazolecarboxamide formyltransferase/IMP cyclohydrolase
MGDSDAFPENLELRLFRKQILRYGENPHQSAALYAHGDDAFGIASAEQLQGKELSYNNINDADAALQAVLEFDEPACVIVKHMNPCGAALGEHAQEAYRRALACDPVSAFGGIVAINSRLTAALASDLVEIFLEVVIAPDIEEEARAILSAKPNLRVLLTGPAPERRNQRTVRTIMGGVLIADSDEKILDGDVKTMTKRSPSARELADMLFAFTIAKHVKSNAIVYAKDGATLGIGAGQMSRIYSAKIAALKAAEANLSLEGAVMASDAFMPFPDCVEAAHEAHATAIIQPGGSVKDKDSIDAADSHDMTMVFTGIRHFRH